MKRKFILIPFMLSTFFSYSQDSLHRQGSYFSFGVGTRNYDLKPFAADNLSLNYLKQAEVYNKENPAEIFLCLDAHYTFKKGYNVHLNASSQDDIHFINYNIELGKKVKPTINTVIGWGLYNIPTYSPTTASFYEFHPEFTDQLVRINENKITKFSIANPITGREVIYIPVRTIHGKVMYEKTHKHYQISIGPKFGLAYLKTSTRKTEGTSKDSYMPFIATQTTQPELFGFIEPQFVGSIFPKPSRKFGIDIGIQLKVSYLYSRLSYNYKETIYRWTEGNSTIENYRGPSYNLNRLDTDISLVLRW